MAFNMGRYAESKEFATEALALAREIGDLAEIAKTLQNLTLERNPADDPQVALARYEEIRGIAATLGDIQLLAGNLNNMGEWHRDAGRGAEAAACSEESLALSRRSGNPRAIPIVLCNYAQLLLGEGDVVRGRTLLNEAFTMTMEHGLRSMERHVLAVGAALAAMRADPQCAARMNGASLALMREGSTRRESIDEAFLAPRLAAAREALGSTTFEAAERAGAALQRETALDELGVWLAGLPDAP
jgi:tetratricopeptide (TPR) repeat protein